MTWHLDGAVWEAYAAGRLDPVAEASVDAHVVRCADCRAAARAHAPAATADDVWAAVRTTITTPPPTAAARLLRRLGMRADDVVLLSGVESLLLPWAVAVGFAVVSACLVGLAGLSPANRDAVFLALAPLTPVLAVVAAYDASDPLRELSTVTPYSKLRLALLRATAALAVALPVTAAVGLVVPGLGALAWVWLAPSLALTAGTLVLLTWWEAQVAGAMVCSVWAGAVAVVRTGGDVEVLATPVVQLVVLAVGAALATTLVLRTSTLRIQGGDL